MGVRVVAPIVEHLGQQLAQRQARDPPRDIGIAASQLGERLPVELLDDENL